MMGRRVVVLAALLVATPVYPCGGPSADIVDRPLVPVTRYLDRLIHDDEYESTVRQELRFLEPLRLAMPDSIADVYDWSYVTGAHLYSPYMPDDTVRTRYERELLEPVYAAVERGAFADAVSRAKRAVEAVLDQPAGLAVGYRDVLRTAVEVVDVVPGLPVADRMVAAQYFRGDSAEREALGAAGVLPATLREALAIRRLRRDSAAVYADAHATSPRVASLRFVALQQAMRTGIPDGYASTIKDSVPPATWRKLERAHDAWLRAYGSHVMADYVRLSKVRLFYFMGAGDRAWNELLAIYPRHRQRVLGEMRYLAYQSVLPASLDDARIDWPLRAGLLLHTSVSPDQWNTYWRAAEAHPNEPWSLPMQERLLWRAIPTESSRGGTLPTAFPTRALAPTPLWASLRLIALLQVGNIDAAVAQADVTPDSIADVSAIRARLHLFRGEWGRAIAVLGESDPSTSYLIRVLAPARVVDSLAAARSAFSTEARLTVAGRLASAGDWRGAARTTAGSGPERARLWARAARLAADTSRAGMLAFARWMRDQHGQLFFGENTDWLRALNWRLYAVDAAGGLGSSDPSSDFDPRLPWTPSQENERIVAHLRSTTELFHALTSYARWLDGATATTPGLAAVVREADQVYNRLASWDSNNTFWWSRVVEPGPEARSIRRAGALLRRR